MAETKLTMDQQVRLLRAKEAELEHRFAMSDRSELDWLIADVSLLFGMLAQHLEEEMQDGTSHA